MAGKQKFWQMIGTGITAAGLLGGLANASLAKQAPVRPLLVDTRTEKAGAPTLFPENQGLPASELLLFLQPGTDAIRFARETGLTLKSRLHSDPNACVFAAASPQIAVLARQRAENDRRVRFVAWNRRLPRVRHAFVPNDPYFAFDIPMGWPGQWTLVNAITPGLDAGVQGAWNRDLTGEGVTLATVDDGLEITHPDLAPNFDADDSYNFADNHSDPSPVFASDVHGTAVAGIAAARGGNGIGITGAAPYASLAGLRIDYNGSEDIFADATLYHSSGVNTGIQIKNHSYGFTTPYVLTEAESIATALSASAGTIHVFSAGNERGTRSEDANKQDLQNSPDVITVGALGSDGKFAFYSNFGACLFACVPSSSATGLSVTTTDRVGNEGYNYYADASDGDPFPDTDYTGQFGGTSASAPLMAGILALGKQAQPALNIRFAKHLIARTALVVDAADPTPASDGGWKTNAAGFHFNQNYGFGLLRADVFTRQAVRYSGVTPLTSVSTGTLTVNAALPDNNSAGVSRTFTVASVTPLEEMLVTLNVTHPARGQVEATLTSPRGTVCRLMRQANDSVPNLNWTFCANAFWGETPQGTWTLTLRDTVANRTGTWNSFAVTLRSGTLVGQTLAGSVTLPECVQPAQTLTFDFRPVGGGTAFTRTVALNTNSAFVLTDLPAGNYQVAVQGAKWLRKVVSADLSTGSVLNFQTTLIPGDANGDNSVDALDLALLIEAFNTSSGEPGYNLSADFNCDGSADALDLALLIGSFNREGDM